MQTKFSYIYIFYSLIFLLGCSTGVIVSDTDDEFSEVFQNLLNENINDSSNNPGVSMAVVSSKLGVNWAGASGYDSMDKTDSLVNAQPFRIASVTKTFVAATVLRMVEESLLKLSDPISTYLDSSFVVLLRKDGYDTEKITIDQCLTHTSGLFNYAQGGKSYLDKVFDDPKHKWDRMQQLEHAMEFGSLVGQPGDKYHYSDTGYILLGHIIEKISNDHYGVMMRSLLNFEKLDIHNTWLENYEEIPVGSRKEVLRYYDGEDYSHLDASVDLFGGGGLMSTTSDLATFLHALFNKGIFDNEKTLGTMIAKVKYSDKYNPSIDKKYLDYRMGLYRISIYGMDAYMHSGFWGTQFMHVPELNATIATDILNGSGDRLLKKTVLYLKNVHNSN